MRDEECIVESNGNVDTRTQLAHDWVSQVNVELNKFPETRATESKRWEHQSIHRVPQSVKVLCGSAYQPQTVSIGPYHHGEPPLQSMEEHKHRAVLTFLSRHGKPLRCYLDALEEEVENLIDAYDQLEPKWRDKEAFLKLMMLDGCFILELIRTTAILRPEEYAHNDPVFSYRGLLYFFPYLRRDMLMLENQIPLQVLNIILTIAQDGALSLDGQTKHEELNMLVLEYFAEQQIKSNTEKFGKCRHILDLYSRSMLLRDELPQEIKLSCTEALCGCYSTRMLEEVRDVSATTLTKAGIRIEHSKTCKLNDISFSGGVLKLPRIRVYEGLESEYRNMIAWERFYSEGKNEVTGFVCFMKSLIQSERDVKLLQSRGVIDNFMGSDNYKAVFNLFDSLSRDASLHSDTAIGLVLTRVIGYCHMPLPRCIAYTNRIYDYLTTPWIGLSILAGILIFALTAIQTAYTVLAYHHSK